MSRVVVKLGGRVAATSLALVRDRHAAGDEVVVVHGGGPQITAELEALGVHARFVGGRRVTDDEALVVVRRALVAVGAELCAALGEIAVHLVGDEIGLEAVPRARSSASSATRCRAGLPPSRMRSAIVAFPS